MKTTGICPKCQSQDIYSVPNSVWSGSNPYIKTGLTFLSSTSITRYLCGQCGYLEEWVADWESLQTLRSSLAGRKLADLAEDSTAPFVEVEVGVCPACGAKVTPEDEVCPSCGISFWPPQEEEQP